MIELLLPCGFDTLEYSWVKATISICTPVDYSMDKKHQQLASDMTPCFSLGVRPGACHPIIWHRLAREPIVLNHEGGSSAAMTVMVVGG
jgi:hypothetical protein